MFDTGGYPILRYTQLSHIIFLVIITYFPLYIILYYISISCPNMCPYCLMVKLRRTPMWSPHDSNGSDCYERTKTGGGGAIGLGTYRGWHGGAKHQRPSWWHHFLASGGVESTGTLHGNRKKKTKINDFPLETPENYSGCSSATLD